jgi:hypothetical protein
MTSQEKLKMLAMGLHGVTNHAGLMFNSEIMSGEVDVLVVTIQDREAFPIYLTIDESQILCMTHIWTESEIIADKKTELLDVLLSMNIPMPLSAFSKIGHQYVIFGALSTQASINEVIEEICVLSDNTLIAIEELQEFLS